MNTTNFDLPLFKSSIMPIMFIYEYLSILLMCCAVIAVCYIANYLVRHEKITFFNYVSIF